MPKKYVLNIKTTKYHIINGCKNARQYSKNDPNMKEYVAEEDIIAEHQNYVSRCKICFKNK